MTTVGLLLLILLLHGDDDRVDNNEDGHDDVDHDRYDLLGQRRSVTIMERGFFQFELRAIKEKDKRNNFASVKQFLEDELSRLGGNFLLTIFHFFEIKKERH